MKTEQESKFSYWVILLTILVLLAVINLFVRRNMLIGYSEVIKKTWGLEIPKGYVMVYEKSLKIRNNNVIRYYAFDYIKNENLQEFVAWSNEFDDSDYIVELLNHLNVSDDYQPSFESTLYYVYSKPDSSSIYLFYHQGSYRLYVLEDFKTIENQYQQSTPPKIAD